MGRPKTISDEALLETARDVFLREGAQASTAEIARSAGVSEGLIFKRFATKDALFRSCFDVSDLGAADLGALVGQGDIRDNLALIAREQIRVFRILMPFVLMRLGASGLKPTDVFAGMCEPPPVRNMRRIAAYFEGEMELGRLKRVDPLALARILIASTHNLVFFELAGLDRHLPTDDEAFTESLVSLVLDGVRPAPWPSQPNEVDHAP